MWQTRFQGQIKSETTNSRAVCMNAGRWKEREGLYCSSESGHWHGELLVECSLYSNLCVDAGYDSRAEHPDLTRSSSHSHISVLLRRSIRQNELTVGLIHSIALLLSFYSGTVASKLSSSPFALPFSNSSFCSRFLSQGSLHHSLLKVRNRSANIRCTLPAIPRYDINIDFNVDNFVKRGRRQHEQYPYQISHQ